MTSDQKDFITWTQFCKDPLPDRSFTFWEWFFNIMKLTKDHLLGIWKKELVVGFINKLKTEEVLRQNSNPGIFLLRFSDSELGEFFTFNIFKQILIVACYFVVGGISVAFIGDDGTHVNLSPWTARDLNIRGLADRVKDLNMLRYVYPLNQPRDESFGEFYTQRMGNDILASSFIYFINHYE